MPKAISAPDVDIAKELITAAKALAPAVKRLEAIMKKLDPKKLPIGSVSDLLYDLRDLRQMVGVLTDPLTEVIGPAIKTLEEHFIQTLTIGESSGVQGKYSRVQVTDSVVPVVADWDKFYAYIKKNSAFELLNRAVNRDAVRERWDAKKQVPGIDSFHAKKVSCTKLTGKGGR
jgi:hypothetical protein